MKKIIVLVLVMNSILMASKIGYPLSIIKMDIKIVNLLK